jgi:hypothetical protein
VKETYQGIHIVRSHSSTESPSLWLSGTSCPMHNKVISYIEIIGSSVQSVKYSEEICVAGQKR